VLPLLPREGKSVFAALSARVGSISDNRLGGWYGYRASKAALNQLIRTLSIELARQRKDAICVVSIPAPWTARCPALSNAERSASRMGWKRDCGVSGPVRGGCARQLLIPTTGRNT